MGLTADVFVKDAKEEIKRPHTSYAVLSHYFMGPDDYCNIPANTVLHFIRSVGLLKG
jgi:hypothetical protein